MPNANGLKAKGSHILALGVGNGLTSQSSLDRMIAVSGPDVFSGTGTFNISTHDVYREPDFSKLEQALRAAAFQLCAPSVNIRKLVDEDPSAGENLQPGVGWSMNATVSPTPSSWVLPPAGAVPSTTTTTGPDGFANFQWRKTTAGSSTIAVTEALQAGYVNDQAATHCTYRTPDAPTDQPLPGFTPTTNGFNGTVPQDSIVTCLMINRRVPVPAIDIEKATNGVDADLPTGPNVPVGTPVTWTYVVTNTGNIPVSGVQVTDSDLGVVATSSCTPAVTTLAPGGSMTCTRSDPTADPGQYANTGTVNATAQNGAPVTDADNSHYFGLAPAHQHREGDERRRRRLAAGAVHHPGHLGHLDVRGYEHGEHSAGGRGRHGQPTWRHPGLPGRRHRRRRPARPDRDVDVHGYRHLRQRRSVRERGHGGRTRRRRRRLRCVALLRRPARHRHREGHERCRRRPAAGAQRPGGHPGHLDVRRHEHGEHPGLEHPGYGQRRGRRHVSRCHQPRAGSGASRAPPATRPPIPASTRTPAP